MDEFPQNPDNAAFSVSPAAMSPASQPLRRPSLRPDLAFLAGSLALFLILEQLLRALLLWRNFDLAAGIPATELAEAFAVGLRFDLIVAALIHLPLALALVAPQGLGRRRLARLWLTFAGAVVLFLGMVEPEFYDQFHVRLNSLAVQYLKEDPGTVTSMLWHGFPVLRYLALWAALTALLAWALKGLDRLTPPGPRPTLARRLPLVLVVLFLLAWGARGTLRQGPPLRWGDAFHGPHLFANHLALNGTWSLWKAVFGRDRHGLAKRWLEAMPADQALARTRRMLLTDRDRLLLPDRYPILRRPTPQARLPKPPRNLVLIIMESFSARFVGALGHDHGITPHFDRLAAQGLLFDRFFSSGTHTHQGMFASVACFPNLPGFEYLMQSAEGQHRFSGLPALLKPRGFQDLYVYNGDFAWDNQKGFFRNQGMSRFIGRYEIESPVFIDPTWGASDQDMFDQALREIARLDPHKPFFAVLQTLSNHTPYALPDPLPVPPVTDKGRLNEHLTAMRYADWALGRFFEAARRQPWFDDTLFVLVGDHGFGMRGQISDIDLLRFHVPLLILGPGVRETFGAVDHRVGSQPDIVPTAVALLGRPFVHQCWGRNLLDLPADDPGFAVIKPSGSDQTIALIRGEKILVKPPTGAPVTGIYDLEGQAVYRDRSLPDGKAMYQDLVAFVATALRALLDNKTGLPEEDAGEH